MTGTSARSAGPLPERILLLFGSDGIGGIERRLAILVDAFQAAGVTCELAALTAASAPHGLLSHRNITVLDPARSRAPWRSARRLWRLRELIRARRSQVILAFGHFANALAASAAVGLECAVVLSEIVSPFTTRRRTWNRTVMHSYRLADSLVLQTERLAADIAALPGPRRRLVIPNPVSPIALALPPDWSARPPRIVAAGRLVPHKRYHDLVAAFANIAAEFPQWRVDILGDGPERATLQAAIARHGLEARVSLPGHVPQPWQQMRHAAILAHCAEIEGFCNTIVEGLAAGCAVVSADCPYGPREILGTTNGLLYPPGDVEALSTQLRRLMSDQALRERFARAGHASLAAYDISRVTQQWLDELSRVYAGKP